jgi:hypothetical protein
VVGPQCYVLSAGTRTSSMTTASAFLFLSAHGESSTSTVACGRLLHTPEVWRSTGSDAQRFEENHEDRWRSKLRDKVHRNLEVILARMVD